MDSRVWPHLIRSNLSTRQSYLGTHAFSKSNREQAVNFFYCTYYKNQVIKPMQVYMFEKMRSYNCASSHLRLNKIQQHPSSTILTWRWGVRHFLTSAASCSAAWSGFGICILSFSDSLYLLPSNQFRCRDNIRRMLKWNIFWLVGLKPNKTMHDLNTVAGEVQRRGHL